MRAQLLSTSLVSLALAFVACSVSVPDSPSAGTPGIGATSGGHAGATGGATGATGGASPVGTSGLPVPPGSVTVSKPVVAAGGMTILPWAGFKAAVSYTFDDANSSQIANYPKLNALGVPFTFYLQTGKSDAANAVWAQALLDGHELGNHTQNHLQTGTADVLGKDIDAATDFIKQKFGVNALTLAAPYGAADYVELAKTRFLLNRGVSGGQIGASDSTDPYSLPCYIPSDADGASATAFDAKTDAARAGGKWQVVLVHGFSGGTDGAYQPVNFEAFTTSVARTKGFGDVWIGTLLDVGAYWRAQQLLAAVTPTKSGTDTVWTWTLPDHFPTGKFLRVKVDGGTLKQGGATLGWNDHGYYEVALDRGTLTLSP